MAEIQYRLWTDLCGRPFHSLLNSFFVNAKLRTKVLTVCVVPSALWPQMDWRLGLGLRRASSWNEHIFDENIWANFEAWFALSCGKINKDILKHMLSTFAWKKTDILVWKSILTKTGFRIASLQGNTLAGHFDIALTHRFYRRGPQQKFAGPALVPR